MIEFIPGSGAPQWNVIKWEIEIECVCAALCTALVLPTVLLDTAAGGATVVPLIAVGKRYCGI